MEVVKYKRRMGTLPIDASIGIQQRLACWWTTIKQVYTPQPIRNPTTSMMLKNAAQELSTLFTEGLFGRSDVNHLQDHLVLVLQSKIPYSHRTVALAVLP
jgi:hypothetical protein